MFLMPLGIRGTFESADYESGGGCINNLLLIHFWVYYHLLILLIDFIINHY